MSKKLKILHIEDDVIEGMKFQKILSSLKLGHSFIGVNSAEEAEHLLNQKDTSKSSKDDFYVNVNKRLIKIDFSSVLLIEAKGDYIQIQVENDKPLLVHSTLKKIEEKLPKELFLKIHRSYIINLQKIIDIEHNSVLIDKKVIPISRTNKTELIRRLNLL